jgi:two-component system, OmpR family, sensor kinase
VGAVLWAIVVGATLAGVAIGQYWRVSVRAMDGRLLADAEALARGIGITAGVLEVDVPAEVRAELAIGESYYGIYDADGRLLDGDAPSLDDAPMRTGVVTVNSFREARVTAPMGAAVRIGRPLAPLRDDLGRLATSVLVASLAACLLAVPLAFWLRRQLARSISQIGRTAVALAPGQPARIDIASVDEEYAGVAARLNEAFDRLEQGLARERQLTADASHELRTPVTTIVAESEWALARTRSDDEYRHALEVCGRQGRRLKEVLETLLAIARIEGGSQAPRLDDLDLATLVEHAVADAARSAGERQITITHDGHAKMRGDRVQLGILVSNLISNAVRYNRDGGTVHVSVATDGAVVRLEVRDTGHGLEPGMAERVFDRFWRAESSRSAKQGGSGLGLAISKAVVDAHGGTITCQSSPDGTTFIVVLPVG